MGVILPLREEGAGNVKSVGREFRVTGCHIPGSEVREILAPPSCYQNETWLHVTPDFNLQNNRVANYSCFVSNNHCDITL